MEQQNVGSAACVENCSTMLFRWTKVVFDGLGAHTLPTIMQTGPTLLWTKARPSIGWSNAGQRVKAISSVHHVWAVFIIGIAGLKLRD
jgi:hypothetical protein